nr:RNA-directed DNA polymerase, eukaryota [Tanacetum cinerariifolium]
QSNAKNQWNACTQYVYVVDAFIPNRRSKAGKRFGFVRFIKVFDVKRFVNNLCTVWIGRHRIQANVARKDKGEIDTSNSYAHVVKGGSPVNGEVDNNPALVLDESCLNLQDYSRCLMGKLQQASTDFITDKRVTWVELEGKAYWVRAKEVLGWVLDFVEQDDEESDSDDEHSEGELNGDILRSNKDLEGDNEKDLIPDTVFEDNLPKPHDGEASVGQNEMHLKYPPGFTPKEDVETNVEQSKKRNGYVREVGEDSNRSDDMKSASKRIISKEEGTKSVCSGHIKKSETPRSGGSILSLMDELVKAGQTMGYNMDGYSVGNSGWILCVWETNSFKKLNATVSDYLVMIRGTGVTNGKSFLIISVYAPQELTEKKLLWDYLCHVIANWKGEVIVMGDFNEVRNKNERFGSVFNMQGANAFNSFISSAGLEEVPFGVDGFEKLVNETWSEAHVDMSNAMLNLMKRLKYLKKKIRAWNNDMRKYSKNNKLTFKVELENLDSIIDKREGVLENETWIDNPVLVKNEFLSHFKNRFERPKEARLNLNMKFPCKLTFVQQSDLEIDVSNNEIKRVVWDYGVDKSPGPDGFTFGFNRHFWKLIENDVVATMKYFFQIGSIPKCCNSSFIALISKIPDAKMVKDFRPISLIVSLYKIIAKILANRLVVVLKDIVNEVVWMDLRLSLIFMGFGDCEWEPHGGILILQWSQTRRSSISLFIYFDYGKPLYFISKSRGCGDSNIDTIFHVLECFHRALGLCINTSKSKLMRIATDVDRAEQVASKIGNSKSDHTSIWRDIVQEMEVFKKQESHKRIDVAAKLTHSSVAYSFRRAPKSGEEQSQLADLLTTIEGVSLVSMNDRWVWSLEGSGNFSVASVRKLIDDRRLPDISSKTRWIKAVPIKVIVHALKVRLDSLPARLNISRRGMDIAFIFCSICAIAVESSRRLFFDCHVAKDLFRKISRWWDLSYMEMSLYDEWLAWILNLRLSVKHKRMLEGTWKVCNDYRTVVDVFIPFKKSKAELDSIETKEKLLNHTGVGSWFYIIKKASDSFETDERIIWGELMEWEDTESKSLSCKNLCLKTKSDVSINGRWKIIVQDDGVEDIADDKEGNGLSDIERVSESSFMQAKVLPKKTSTTAKQEMVLDQRSSNTCSKKIVGGSILEVMDELVKVGQTMGYNMEGCAKNIEAIVGSQGGLIDLPLEGYAFIWAHKSDSKMSKLDRFVETTWKSMNVDESNGLIRLKKNLQCLKNAIMVWARETRTRLHERKTNIKQKLLDVDKIIDKEKRVMKTQNISTVSLTNRDHHLPFVGHLSMEIGFLIVSKLKDLERNVTYDEVKRAVWDCGANKSPGLDGFTFEFFCKFWRIIDQDVFQAIFEFFKNDHIPRGCKSSFIALIPKIQDDELVKDFCPISLIRSVYKIITKKRKKRAMIFKVDFEKAFNLVKWDYLIDSLKAFDFGQKWKKVGNGENTSFWDENLLGDDISKSNYPRLYALEEHKTIYVADKLHHPSLVHSFRRLARGGAEEVQLDSLRTRTSIVTLPNMADHYI